MPQIAVYRPRLRLRWASPQMVIYVRSGTFFSFAPLVKNVLFITTTFKVRLYKAPPRPKVELFFIDYVKTLLIKSVREVILYA